jgi:hypothetical protein
MPEWAAKVLSQWAAQPQFCDIRERQLRTTKGISWEQSEFASCPRISAGLTRAQTTRLRTREVMVRSFVRGSVEDNTAFVVRGFLNRSTAHVKTR